MPTRRVDLMTSTMSKSQFSQPLSSGINVRSVFKEKQETKERLSDQNEGLGHTALAEQPRIELSVKASPADKMHHEQRSDIDNLVNSGILSYEKFEIEVESSHMHEIQGKLQTSNTSLNKYSSMRNSMQRSSTMTTMPSDGLLNQQKTKFDFLKTPMSKPKPDFTQPSILNISSATQLKPMPSCPSRRNEQPRKYDPDEFIKVMQKNDQTILAKPVNFSHRTPINSEPFYMSPPSNPLCQKPSFSQSTGQMAHCPLKDITNMSQKDEQINYVARIYQREPTITRRIFVSPQPVRYASPQSQALVAPPSNNMRRCQSEQIDSNEISTPNNLSSIPATNNYINQDRSFGFSATPHLAQQNSAIFNQIPVFPMRVIPIQIPAGFQAQLPKESNRLIQNGSIPLPSGLRPQAYQNPPQRSPVMLSQQENKKPQAYRPLSVNVAKAQPATHKSYQKLRNPLQFRLESSPNGHRSQSNPVTRGLRHNQTDFQTYIYKQ